MRCGAGLHRACSRNPNLAQRLDGSVTGLGQRGGITGEHGTGCDLGVETIGLALPAALVPIGLVDLDHVETSLTQVPAQTRSPRTGTFDADGEHLTEVGDPTGQLAIAAWCRRERGHVELAAELVKHDHDVELLVRVDTGDDANVVFCDGGHCRPLLFGWLGVARTAGRVDRTGSRPGSSGAS